MKQKARKRKSKKQLSTNQKIRRLLNKHKIVLLTTMGIVVAIGLFVVNSQADTGRLVTFHDRGQDHVILTKAGTVRDALKNARITVDQKDIVEPAIDSQLQSTDSAVIIYRARPVLVIDGAFRERILTPAQSPNEIATAIGIDPISDKDKTTITNGDFVRDGASTILSIERAQPAPMPAKLAFAPSPNSLTRSKGAQLYTDGSGVVHRETYYDLPMNIVIQACGSGGVYTIRYDGAKIDKDGYVLVAANYGIYPRCSVVETSMGPGKVYDTGGFALRYPHGFDLATDWTNGDGR